MIKNKTAINFCPTGMVPTKKLNSNVPVSVSEIIEETHQAYEIGITIAHLHARNEDETPTYKKSVYQHIFEGVRKHCPDLIICGSTSGRDTNEFDKRSEVIELKPDMCSLTLSSLNFINQASINAPDMIRALLEKMNKFNVIPELECFDLGMINYGNYLISKGLINGPRYWNLLFGNIFGMQSNLSSISTAISQINLDDHSYISLGGLGDAQLLTLQIGILTGHGVRVGLEDNLWFDKKRTIQASNNTLLQRTHEIMRINETELFSSKEFKENVFHR